MFAWGERVEVETENANIFLQADTVKGRYSRWKERIPQEEKLAQARVRREGKRHAVQKATGKIIGSAMPHGQAL